MSISQQDEKYDREFLIFAFIFFALALGVVATIIFLAPESGENRWRQAAGDESGVSLLLVAGMIMLKYARKSPNKKT
jgi:hypothetical protein